MSCYTQSTGIVSTQYLIMCRSAMQGLQQKLEREARRANEMTAKVKQVSEYLKKVCGAAVPTRIGSPNAVW